MIDEQFTPAEQQLIQRLKNAPKPEFTPRQLEATRQRLFQEVDRVFMSPAHTPPRFLNSRLLIVMIVIVAVAIIAVVLITPQAEQPDAAVTLPQPSPTPTPELQQTIEAVVTTIAIPDAQIIEAILVIEGPVEAINTGSITIFGIEVRVDGDDPVLAEVQIGETVRVEGNAIVEADTIIIVAVKITITEPEIIPTMQPSGGALPANCRRTPKGKIKCSRR